MSGTLVVKELIHLKTMPHSYRNKSLDLQWSSIDLLEFDWNVNLNGLKFSIDTIRISANAAFLTTKQVVLNLVKAFFPGNVLLLIQLLLFGFRKKQMRM